MMTAVRLLALMLCGALATPPSDTGNSDAFSEFARSNHLFTSNLYKEIIKNENGNIVVSPFSAELILALTNEGAEGITSEELQTGLSLSNDKQITKDALKFFLPTLKSSEENLKLLSANKIYVGKDVTVKESFKNVAISSYNSDIENIDFAANSAATRTINEWVEDKTNNKIKEIVKPNDLSLDTKLLLVNTLYFRGKWEIVFNFLDTYKDKFYISKDDVKEVDMMQQTDSYKFYENQKLNTKFIELPYKGANISLVIALPNEINGISKLEENIAEVVQPKPFTYKRVEVRIPKFKIETNVQLKPILKQMGIKKIFTPQADLSGLTNGSEKGLFVDNVIQKTFINVAEDGTEAAAAAVLTIAAPSLPPPPDFFFKANHPFLYYITHNNIILFIGRYRQ